MILKRNATWMSPSGFQAPPPNSRPPTKTYDRNSFVLVLDESDEVLKFMKMHLNRYFSHVAVTKSATDAVQYLKQKSFDVVITEAQPSRKNNAEFPKKLASQWKHIPVILTDNESPSPCNADEYTNNLVIDVVEKPFDLDTLHVAIRRALNVRTPLQAIAEILPAKASIGSTCRTVSLNAIPEKARESVEEVRKLLVEEIEE